VTRKTGAIATLAVALAIGLALLGSAWPSGDSITKKEKFCSHLDSLARAMTNFQSLNWRTATEDQTYAAFVEVSDAWDAAVDLQSRWRDAYVDPLVDSWRDLGQALERFPRRYSAGRLVRTLKTWFETFPVAFRVSFVRSGCGPD
jgi:hypothetical protein